MTDIEQKKTRSSNIELYRILVMLLIVAHHYVVNSGLMNVDGPLFSNPTSSNTYFYLLLGMWGKTGINCFVLITGFFMCYSNITLRKYLKLYLEVKFYRYVILFIFAYFGMTAISGVNLLKSILPFSSITDSFTNAYMAFFLFIPFLNILIKGLTKNQHLLLMILCISIYSGFYQIPGLRLNYNYLSWFIILYITGSYIRIYGLFRDKSALFWGGVAIGSIISSAVSVLASLKLNLPVYAFVGESLAFMSVITSIALFMFFKNLNIGYSKIINMIGATTFGVFLIHTRGDEMRQWLWQDFVDVVGHYDTPYYGLYAIGCILAIFAVCSLIDICRIHLFERPLFAFLDKKFGKNKFYAGVLKKN